MIPDPYCKTVKIPVKITNGVAYLFPEGKLPELEDGTIGDLVVPAYAFKNPKLAAVFTKEFKEQFLPATTLLIAQINPEHVPKHFRDKCRTDLPGLLGTGVEFILTEEQTILRRGAKSAELMSCKCKIPSLGKKAKSINHAYTLISQAYEPRRMSHTGNVFSKIFYSKDKRWQPLKCLRGY